MKNKVKYPSKEMIDQQVSEILDRSGLFEKEEFSIHTKRRERASEEFIRCVPVKEKKSVVSAKVVASLVSVAAAIMLMVAVSKYEPVKRTRQEPLNPVTSDTTQITSTHLFRNEHIAAVMDVNPSMARLSLSPSEVSSSISLKENGYMGTLSSVDLNVYYDNALVAQIEDAMTDMEEQITEHMTNIYKGYYAGKYAGDIEVSYEPDILDAGLDNTAIVSLTHSVTITTNGIPAPQITTQMYGACYDLEKNQKLTLSDLFTDEDKGIEDLTALLLEKMSKEPEAADYVDEYELDLATRAVEDSYWYFQAKNIIITVNDYSVTEADSTEAYRTQSCKTFAIPISELHYLKSAYQ